MIEAMHAMLNEDSGDKTARAIGLQKIAFSAVVENNFYSFVCLEHEGGRRNAVYF
jgi:hypothetical protein